MLIRSVVFGVLCSVLTLTARAQGLVQIVFEGAIAQEGGARVELDVRFETHTGGAVGQGRTELGLYLANHTSAAEVAALLTRELDRAGAFVVAPHSGGGDSKRASVFVDRAFAVGLRMGRGLSAQVCLCEEAPALVRILPPKELKEAARFTLNSSTEHPHTKDRGRFELALDFAANLLGEQAADVLTTGALNQGWAGQWLDHQAWRPQGLSTGAAVTGTCVAVKSRGDWRLEVELEKDSAR